MMYNVTIDPIKFDGFGSGQIFLTDIFQYLTIIGIVQYINT